MNQEAIKPAQAKLSLAFCVYTGALCELSVLFGVACHYFNTKRQIWRASNDKLLECVADYRKRVSIQFGSHPPRFLGMFSTEVAPQQVLVMEQEVKALLEKGAIEYVPHSNRETGFTASIS